MDSHHENEDHPNVPQEQYGDERQYEEVVLSQQFYVAQEGYPQQ
jgi:hypothetical protein